jgi:hypothetical protein
LLRLLFVNICAKICGKDAFARFKVDVICERLYLDLEGRGKVTKLMPFQRTSVKA